MIYAIAILCPPLALLLMGRGLHALINIPLTLFFWLPGVVHACVVISRMERDWRDERLACMLKGVPPPPRPGTVPGWASAVVITFAIAVFFVGGYIASQPSAKSLHPSDRESLATAAAPAAPEIPAKPAAGALFAEVVAAFGEPNLAQKETGWAYWNGFKARFQEGRVVEVASQE